MPAVPRWCRSWWSGVIIHRFTHGFAGREDFRFGHGWSLRPRLGEKVTAQQRTGRLIGQHATVPTVRHMRCVDPLPRLLSYQERLAIRQSSTFLVGLIVERCHHADMTSERDCLWCGRQKFVHGSRFVTFEMGTTDTPHSIPRDGILMWRTGIVRMNCPWAYPETLLFFRATFSLILVLFVEHSSMLLHLVFQVFEDCLAHKMANLLDHRVV